MRDGAHVTEARGRKMRHEKLDYDEREENMLSERKRPSNRGAREEK